MPFFFEELMPFFDERAPRESADEIAAQRATITIIVAAVSTGGMATDAENERIRLVCVRSPVFERNTPQQQRALLVHATDQWRLHGVGAVERAASILTPAYREAAFAMACDVILVDGVLSDALENYLLSLGETVGVPVETVAAVINATVIRNRKPGG